MQTRAVQGMLDFDFVCSRKEPSVVAMVYPLTGDHRQKFYWGHKEVLIPGKFNSSDFPSAVKFCNLLTNIGTAYAFVSTYVLGFDVMHFADTVCSVQEHG